MKIEFEVIQEKEGGYAAACYKERIYTEGKDLEELHGNITAAIDERFEEKLRPKPADVRLVVFRED